MDDRRPLASSTPGRTHASAKPRPRDAHRPGPPLRPGEHIWIVGFTPDQGGVFHQYTTDNASLACRIRELVAQLAQDPALVERAAGIVDADETGDASIGLTRQCDDTRSDRAPDVPGEELDGLDGNEDPS